MNPRPILVMQDQRQKCIDEQLASFGDAHYLFEYRNRPRAFEAQRCIETMISRLQEINFNPDKDFIVMTGQLIYVSLLLTAAISSYSKLHILIFDAANERYVMRVIHNPDTKKA